MAEDESTVAGGGRLLGTNNLQRAVDGIEKTVTRLSSVLGTLAPAVQGAARGQAAAGSWNKLSNWAGTNGGGATFNGQPGSTTPNGGGPSFPNVPNGGAPGPTSHRAPGPATWTGGGNGGAHAGPGNGLYRAGATAGFLVDTARQINESVGQTPSDAATDSRFYLTSGRMMSDGQSVNVRSMFSRNQATGQSATDVSAAAMGAWQNSGYAAGTAGFNRYRNMTGAQNLLNPLMSAAQATSATAQFGTARGYNMMRMVGIQTLTGHGVQKTPTMIANEILNRLDPGENVRTKEQIAALVHSPTSPLNMELGNWVSNGAISTDQVDLIKSSIEAILKARQHGVGAADLSTLLNQRQSTNKSVAKKAAATLRGMHIADTQEQRDKDLAGSQREGTVSRLDGFEKGLTASTQALQDFHDKLNKFTPQWLNDATGLSRGLRDNGRLGTVLGSGRIAGQILASGAGTHGLSSYTTGVTGSETGALTHGSVSGYTSGYTSGVGGDNESRMSVLALRGSSGSPHNASAAAMGGMAAGGPANSTGRSGGTAKRKAGSSGQRMILPARGPLGAYFGQRGHMWSSGHHTGQDIICPAGTPVHAPADGTVIFAGNGGPYGNLVKIDHGGGVVSYLAHNSRFAVHVGAHVRQGQLVAYSGATGNVSGAHCHFEVRVNGHSVNPMRYVNGAGRVSGAGGGAGTSGSGTNSPNGSGTTTTDSGSGSGSGGGMAGSSIGMSELDVLAGTLSGGSSDSGDSANAGSTGSGTSGGGGGGQGPSGTPGATTGGLAGNRKIVNQEASKYGWGKGPQWNTLVSLIMGESGFDNHAQNPHSSAHGIFQFLNSTWASYGGHKTDDPRLQSVYGMRYIKSKYGSPISAKRAWDSRSPHWYDKGAWDLKEDEDARVHKGEMIIPKAQAQQIREVMLNNNPYRASTKGGKGEGVVLKFEEGSIKISLGDSASSAQGTALGKSIVDAIASDSRIKALQNGLAHV